MKLEWEHIKKEKSITATVGIKPHPSQYQTFTTLRDAKAWAQELELKLSPNKFTNVFEFTGEQGKRDSIIVVAQIFPELTARLVDL